MILLSAQGPNASFFLLWWNFIRLGVCLDRGLDLDEDEGPGLDNFNYVLRFVIRTRTCLSIINYTFLIKIDDQEQRN